MGYTVTNPLTLAIVSLRYPLQIQREIMIIFYIVRVSSVCRKYPPASHSPRRIRIDRPTSYHYTIYDQ